MLRFFPLLLLLALGLASIRTAGAQSVVISGVTIVDTSDFGRSQRDVQDAVIIIRDGRIVAAGSRVQTPTPADATIVDARGRYAIPGLIDGFSTQNDQGYANAHLAMGVTTIIVTGPGDQRRGQVVNANPQPSRLELEQVLGYDHSRLDLDARPAGVGVPAYIRSRARRLDEQELRAEVRALAWRGVDGVMLMYPLDDEQVRIATDEAKRLGLFTVGELGHASYAVAARNGVQSFVHTSRIEAELAPPELRRRIADSPFAPADHPTSRDYSRFLAELNTSTAAFSDYARTLAGHPLALMPTLMLQGGFLPGAANPWTSPVGPLIDPTRVEHLPYNRLTGRVPIPADAPSDYFEVRQRRAMKSLETMRAFHAAGVRFLVGSGTDAFGILPGWGEHREIAALVQIGLTPREALAAATENFARIYGLPDRGRLAPGARADIVLLDADPTASAANLERISAVYLAGQRLDRERLLAWRPPMAK